MMVNRRRGVGGDKQNDDHIRELQSVMNASKAIDSHFHLLFRTILDELKKTSDYVGTFKTLVCVQDDNVRKYLMETLSKRGHTVDSVQPDDVLTKYHSDSCSLIIFDDAKATIDLETGQPIVESPKKKKIDGEKPQGDDDDDEESEEEEEEVSAISLCRHVRSVVGDFVVLLLITDATEASELATIMDAGANDYLQREPLKHDPSYLEVRMMSAERQILAQVKVKQAEDLSIVTKRLFKCLEGAGDVVEIWDRQGRIQYVNKKAIISGYTRAELLGSQFMMYLPSSDEYNKIWNAISGANIWNGTLTQRHRDGTTCDYDTTITPIKSAIQGGEIVCFFVNKRRMSEIKQAELEKKREREQAAEKENVRLRMISYDIQTLLSELLGNSHLLTDEDAGLNPEQEKYANAINVAADELRRLVKDLLDIFKIETGKLAIEAVEFDPRAVIDEMLATIQLENPVELVAFTQPDVPAKLMGDVKRFQQILANLLSNALKFTPRGEITVQMHFLEETNDIVMIKLEVRDSGIGIKKDLLNSLFDGKLQSSSPVVTPHDPANPDFQLTQSTGGRGLGLSIIKELTQLVFQGEMGIESEVGRGSTFWCNLKFNKITQPIVKFQPPASTKGVRVLVVERSHAMREVIKTELESLGGMAVTSLPVEVLNSEPLVLADSILEALTQAKQEQQPFRVLLLDASSTNQTNPDPQSTDGEEFFLMLKRLATRLEGLKTTFHIIVLLPAFYSLSPTGQGRSLEVESKLQTYNVSLIFKKPIKQSQLLQSITEVVTVKPRTGRSHPNPVVERRRPSIVEMGLTTTVLVVDDNVVNRQVTQRMLERLNCKVDCAKNGLEAVDAVRNFGGYKLVLMDCEMPVMNGYDATRGVRQIEKEDERQRLVVVAMTANVLSGDVAKCLDCGMDDYLAKPVKLKDLDDTLQKWVFNV